MVVVRNEDNDSYDPTSLMSFAMTSALIGRVRLTKTSPVSRRWLKLFLASQLQIDVVYCIDWISLSLCLFRLCLSSFLQGSRDNMSVVLVCFPGAPKISEEAVKKEEELDKYLETRVEGQHTQHMYT